jgi:hypothetical protein
MNEAARNQRPRNLSATRRGKLSSRVITEGCVSGSGAIGSAFSGSSGGGGAERLPTGAPCVTMPRTSQAHRGA